MVLHALRVPRRGDDGRCAQRLLDADGPVHRRHRARDPASSLCSLLDQGDARHGARAGSTSRSRACSRRACCSTISCSAEPRSGGIDYYPPEDGRRRSQTRDGKVVAGKLKRTAWTSNTAASARCRKSKRNGVDPQELIDRYGADTARAVRDVRRLARGFSACGRMPASKARTGSCGGCGSFAQAHADTVMPSTARRRNVCAAPVKAARREIHLTLKQANYDYERIQYNTVVSAGYEDAERARRRARRLRPARPRSRARVCRSCCACSTPSCRTSAGRCGTISVSPSECGDAARRAVAARSTRRRSRRTRSSSCCRSTASCAASSSCRRPPTEEAIEARAARQRRKSRSMRAGAPMQENHQSSRDGSSMSWSSELSMAPR